MSSAALRQLTMLQLVPRRPPGRTTREIHSALRDRDFDVELRTVQRDLGLLSGLFALTTDDGHPARWHWMPNCPDVSLPSEDPFSALTWQLIEQYLQPLLPRAMQRDAQPRFRAAREYLRTAGAHRLRRWRDRVRIIPRALQLQPPEISPEVLEAVYQGLLESRQLKINYQRRLDQKSQQLTVHPLGLVLREGVIYLLGTVAEYTDIRQMVLHRMSSAMLTEDKAVEIEDFDLDAYIREGGFSYAVGAEIDLVFRLDVYAARHLQETPLAPGQTARELDDGRIEFRATMLDTQQLRWWLLGFGDNLEVVRPAKLRRYVRNQGAALLRHHDGRPRRP